MRLGRRGARARGKARLRRAAAAWTLLGVLALPGATAAVSQAERDFLELYFSAEELRVVSATRSLTSIASVAEDVAVVTAEEIALMNAHSVAEALYFVTGVELADFRGPGTSALASIHGSGRDRVATLLDGVPLDTAAGGFQLATLPAQMVRRIEVVKGPASSTWGSSFGGVVNVITKSAEGGDRVDGLASGSVGSGATRDARAELTARTGPLGLYLFGGRMRSDGLPDAGAFTQADVFARASLDAGRRSRVDVSVFSHDSDAEAADLAPFGLDAGNGFAMDTLHAKADVRSSPRAGVDLALSAWWLRQHDNFYATRPSTGERTRNALVLSERRGASGSVAWRGGGHALVAGADAVAWDFRHEFEPYDAIARYTYALFVNDTVAAGRLSFIPGLRYDHSTLSGGVVSPSLGATWLASPDVLFRASASRGFHDPSIVTYFDAPPVGYYASGGIGAERIWSYQAGLEANAGDLVRFRLTVFRHDVDDVLVPKQLGPGASTTVNAGRGRTTGGELEAATRPLAGFVLKAGVHHERIRQFDFGDALSAPARDVTGASAAVAYEGRGGLRGILQARYLNWDVTERWRADDGGVVVDASLAHELLAARGLRIEVFGAARNLLDAASYGDVTQRNPGRWVEAGARCAF